MNIDLFSLGGLVMVTATGLFCLIVLAKNGRKLSRLERYLTKTCAETDVRGLTDAARQRLAARYRSQFGGSR